MLRIKQRKNKVLRFWKEIGPGLISGASDDDPSGIATYSQAGAAFGLSTLWTALFAFPLMAALQRMCAKIGMVTKKGLSGNLKQYYPKPFLYIMLLFSFPSIVLNIGADIAGMGAVGNLLVPSIPSTVFSIVFTILLLVSIVFLPYQKIASILKYFCLVMLVYFVVPFMVQLDYAAILEATFIPKLEWNKAYIAIIVGILGTTISPYLFFWQASMEVEEAKHKKRYILVNKKVMKEIDHDVDFGMTISGFVMYFIILTTGTVLYQAGVHQIDTVEQAAMALKPLAGEMAYALFAVGVIGTGFIAIPVLSGSLSYIVTEAFDMEQGLDKKFHEAKGFYIVIAISLLLGLAINYVGISPISALIYTAILYGITAPILIVFVLLISNNKEIMGEYVNNTISNVMGITACVVMTIAAICLFVI